MSYNFYTICRITEVDLGNNKIKISSINDMSVRIGDETYNVFVKENTSRNFTISEAFLVHHDLELDMKSLDDFLREQILETFHRNGKIKLYILVKKSKLFPLIKSPTFQVKNLAPLKNNE